jgi:hypothetical protein
MPGQEPTWRIYFVFGTLPYAIAGNDALELKAACVLEGADDARAATPRLISFLAAGLHAPVTALQAKRAQAGRG